MTRRRRAVVLLGLALVLGGLAASDVSRREAALERRLGPAVPAVVARRDLEAGTRLAPTHLAVRRVPARFAPAGGFPSPSELVGLRTAVAVGAGEYLAPGAVSEGAGAPALRPGERVADVVAVGSAEEVTPGGRVDVVVTREGRDGGPGRTDLALEDVEVLGAAPAEESGGENANGRAAHRRLAAGHRPPGRLSGGGAELRARAAPAPARRGGPRAGPRRPQRGSGPGLTGDPAWAGVDVAPSGLKVFPTAPDVRHEASMTRRVPVLLGVLASALVFSPSVGSAALPKAPVITSISPKKLNVGDTLTIRGRYFLPGNFRNTVAFQKPRAQAVFLKADKATKTTIKIKLTSKLMPFLSQKGGKAQPTRFSIRVLAKRFGTSFTSKSLSPTIGPGTGPVPRR